MEDDYYSRLRSNMVKHQIAARGVKDPRVLEAMSRVPRHLFVPESLAERAYDDSPLPIGEGQTISQPYMVAWMTELLEVGEEDRVLEIGTGSGYQAAILCELAAEVISIEKFPDLARQAGVRVSFDGGAGRYRPDLRQLLPLVDICIVARAFAAEYTACDAIRPAAQALLTEGPSLVVITDGINGSWVFPKAAGSFHQPAFCMPQVVDTTGCGDA